MATPDMDVIKEIPGYKVIMKAILKSQIQQLVEQLASHTDEESVILTASVSDGTLSHLGTDSGKNFLDDHEDIKSQFLGFCLKRHHRQKAQQQKEQQQQQQLLQQHQQQLRSPPWPTHHGPGPGGPRPRLGTPGRQIIPRHSVPRYPMSVPSGLGKSVRHEPYPISKPRRSMDGNFDIGKIASALEPSLSVNSNLNSSQAVKLEPEDSSSQHSKNDGESSPLDKNIPNEDNQSHGPNTPGEASDSNTSDHQNSDLDVNVKVEAISEADMELEITGVELGGNSDLMGSQKDPWPTNLPMGFDPTGATGSPGDMQSGYSVGSTRQMRRFPCLYCGKDFSTKQVLQTHVRLHTGEKPFKCSQCDKSFTQKGHLQSHMVKHLDL